MELSQRFQDLIQDLRNHDEEQMKKKLKESMAQRDAEFSQKEKVCIVFVLVMLTILLLLFILILPSFLSSSISSYLALFYSVSIIIFIFFALLIYPNSF